MKTIIIAVISIFFCSNVLVYAQQGNQDQNKKTNEEQIEHKNQEQKEKIRLLQNWVTTFRTESCKECKQMWNDLEANYKDQFGESI